MTKELVDSLGWMHFQSWNNREIYNLGDYYILEHNGSWYISNGEDMYFYEILDDKVFENFSNLVKTKLNIQLNSNKYTLKQYDTIVSQLDEFFDVLYREQEQREEDELNKFLEDEKD